MLTKANIELDAGDKSFGTGLLPELIAALRQCRPGDLLAVISSNPVSAPSLKPGAASRATRWWILRWREAERAGLFGAVRLPQTRIPLVRLDRVCGSTQISIATSIATIVAFGPRPK
jgi:hypothetical protein